MILDEQLINMRLTCDCTHILGLTCLSDRHCVPSAIKMMMIYSFSYRLIELTKGRHTHTHTSEIEGIVCPKIPHGKIMFRNRSKEWRVTLDEYHSSIINFEHHCECSSVLSISGCPSMIWKWVPTISKLATIPIAC